MVIQNSIIIGSALQTVGTLLIGFVALKVHHRVIAEQTVDEEVVKIMKREQKFGIIGLFLIAIGYFIEISSTL